MSDNNYAKFPPRLVRDLMKVGVFTCHADTPVVDLARVMFAKGHEGAVVLDHEGHAVGMVSRVELIKAYGMDSYQDKKAEDIMDPEVPQVPPDIPLSVAAQIMLDRGIRILFMTHHAGGIVYPAAFLTFDHLMRHIVMKDEADLEDLGIRAEREDPMSVYLKRREEAGKKNLETNK